MSIPTRQAVAAVRQFNRFYTRQIGVLNAGFLDSPYSLTEVRILYELSASHHATITALARSTALDLGYVSRIVSAFTRKGLVIKKRSVHDGRTTDLALSQKGRALFRELERRQHLQVEQMLRPVSAADLNVLLSSLQSVQRVLDSPTLPEAKSVTLRNPHPGDMGWIIHRQAILYHQEYGWGTEYEAIVAEITARFIRNFDPKHERCWIAERDGQVIGSIFCVRKTRTIAQLRLLYVEPSARGLGLGTRLVDDCIGFARLAGYRTIVLWTNSMLYFARRIYERAGFTLTGEEAHHSFGKKLVAQTWQRSLR